ncbi:MAG: hypothetical protein A3C36_02200 [Omnitrophica WOR_2 bacterium RIFCSPHIGHO2_02_FULL_52_10]|nr:MAG: hypothetical protein A3C36_02200 [Omnitrophica WOR_2 bacterium RIFCSPHIGHO2_02_FULL_52_10]
MTETAAKLEWETEALRKYQLMISKIPLFHREIAKIVVDKKAVLNARERDAEMVGERDIVNAFFSEVPKAFYSLMIRLLDEVGFYYEENGYGFKKGVKK